MHDFFDYFDSTVAAISIATTLAGVIHILNYIH